MVWAPSHMLFRIIKRSIVTCAWTLTPAAGARDIFGILRNRKTTEAMQWSSPALAIQQITNVRHFTLLYVTEQFLSVRGPINHRQYPSMDSLRGVG